MNVQYVASMASLLLLSLFLLPISAFNEYDTPEYPFQASLTDSLPLPRSCKYVSKQRSYVQCNNISTWDSSSYEHVATLEISNWNSSKIGFRAFCSADCSGLSGLIIKDSEILNKLEEGSFVGLQSLKYLVITRTGLETIEDETFTDLDALRRLHLHSNSLSSFSLMNSSGDTELQTLEELKLDRNVITEMDSSFFDSFNATALQKVSLRAAGLQTIRSGAFCKLNLLTHLDLSEVPDVMDDLQDAFTCINLSHLVLQNNTLDQVDILRIVTPIRSTIRVLILDHNDFGILNISYPLMKKLGVLSLVNCGISNFGRFTFDSLPNLQELRLGANNLLSIPSALYVPSLMYLNLDNNPRHVVDENSTFFFSSSFSGNMSQLRTLTLKGSNMKKLTLDTFRGLRNLTSLAIIDSDLEEIEEYTFDCLSHLTLLELSESRNFHITSNFTFGGLPRLRELRLSLYSEIPADGVIEGPLKNVITASKPFLSLNSLTHLDLTGYNLTETDGNLFWGLFQLRSLKLKATGYLKWKTPLFSRFPVLEEIDLSSNKLITFNNDTRYDLSGLKRIDLSHNPFECSCTTFLNFQDLLDKNITIVNWENPNMYMCLDISVSPAKSISISCAMKQYLSACRTQHFPRVHLVLYIAAPVAFGVFMGVCFWKRRQIYYTTYMFWIRVKKKSFRASFGDCMYDAFVCYCEEDKEWVYSELMLNAEAKGLNLCLHERDFLVGKSVIENIIASIEHSRKIIIVMSKHFIQSRWCLFEVEIAQQRVLKEPDSNMIIIDLEQFPTKILPTSVKYIIKTKTHISWAPDNQSKPLFWAKLIRAIKKNGSSLSSVTEA